VFTAPLYLFRSIIYTSPPFSVYIKNLISSGVRRSSKEFGRKNLIRLKVRKSSKEFRRIDLIRLGVRRTLHEFTGRFINIK